MWRIVDIGGESYFLHVEHDCFVAEKDSKKVLSIHFSDIHSIICHSERCTYSDTFFKKCMEFKIPFLVCDTQHMPLGVMLPLLQHTDSSIRIDLQIQATEPQKKQAWTQIIEEKLKNQSNHLFTHGFLKEGEEISRLVKNIKSGDSDNKEAQGAKIYFSVLFGADFIRSVPDSINSVLDYGYTVLRSCVARAIVGAGLYPNFGIFHSNKQNPFCLIDDLMEPFRPLVDMFAYKIQEKYPSDFELQPQIKKTLITLTQFPVQFAAQTQEFSFALQNYVHSYLAFLEKKEKRITFPKFSYDFTI